MSFDPVRQRKRFAWLDELSILVDGQLGGGWLHYADLLRRRSDLHFRGHDTDELGLF